MLNQITQWCYCIEEIIKIKNVNPNNNSESSASLNQSRFQFKFVIYHYHNIKLGLFIFNLTKKYLLCSHWINAVSENYSKEV